MRQTPRHTRSSRGISTLIGNGWLREAPREAWRKGSPWDAIRRSSLRKCMFMPVPDELRRLFPQVAQAAPRPALPRVPAPEPEIVSRRRDPRKDVREMPAFVARVPRGVVDPRLVAQQAYAVHVQNAQKTAAAAANKPPLAWWEDPVALGSLLILAPPIGLAAVWSSKRYSSEARWALTIMTALTMCLLSAVLIAALTML